MKEDHRILQATRRANPDLFKKEIEDKPLPKELDPLHKNYPGSIENKMYKGAEPYIQLLSMDKFSPPKVVNYLYLAFTAMAEANLKRHLDSQYTIFDLPNFYLKPPFRYEVVGQCINVRVRENFHPDYGPFECLSDKQQIEHVIPLLRAYQVLETKHGK